MMRTLYCTALFALTTVAQAAPSCPLAHWDDYGGATVPQCRAGAYVFATTHAQVDADGANAYHPDDVGLNCKTGTGFRAWIVRPMVAIRMATGGLPPSFRIRRTKEGLRPA